jgi:hypothetical protein
MAVRQRRYSKEELARRGQELYASSIRQQVEAGNKGKIVATEIKSFLNPSKSRGIFFDNIICSMQGWSGECHNPLHFRVNRLMGDINFPTRQNYTNQ